MNGNKINKRVKTVLTKQKANYWVRIICRDSTDQLWQQTQLPAKRGICGTEIQRTIFFSKNIELVNYIWGHQASSLVNVLKQNTGIK